ncbi:hypothetical protein CC2G_002128 [Coprinopsis cinerea AmutBmut pab1-1]|nr:hypothetical protein CC2G_002128 [Coprinopsis cinerea AmutBmut pab1-1]
MAQAGRLQKRSCQTWEALVLEVLKSILGGKHQPPLSSSLTPPCSLATGHSILNFGKHRTYADIPFLNNDGYAQTTGTRISGPKLCSSRRLIKALLSGDPRAATELCLGPDFSASCCVHQSFANPFSATKTLVTAVPPPSRADESKQNGS